MRVKDVMTKDVEFVAPDAKIGEVAKILFNHKYHGLPVVENGKVTGIITEDDFYIKDKENIFLPSYIDFLKEVKINDQLSSEKEKDLKKLLDARAGDIMTQDCLTVSPETELSDFLAMIKKTKFNTWPVTDDQKNLLGIITLVDVIGLINQAIDFQNIQIPAGRNREIDALAQDTHSFWKKTFVLIGKTNIKTWKAIFLLAFISGLAAAIVWNVSLNIH